MPQTHELSLTLKASTLEKEPVKFSLKASADDKIRLVERFGLVSLQSLTAEVMVRNKGAGNGLLVSGQLKAALVQRCTITLADVPEELDVAFDLLLVDPEMANRMDEEESYLDPDAPDYDALEGDTVDVGEIVAQTLSVWMNPYPRAEGAKVIAPTNPNVSLNEPELEKPNPFAALSKLQDKS